MKVVKTIASDMGAWTYTFDTMGRNVHILGVRLLGTRYVVRHAESLRHAIRHVRLRLHVSRRSWSLSLVGHAERERD